MEKYMSDDVKKLIGNSLEPGQDVYEMIKQRVEYNLLFLGKILSESLTGFLCDAC